MNYVKMSLIFMIAASISTISGKNTEFIHEDAYLMQAPQELIATVERAAEVVGYKLPFEVAIPKKPGMEINPWNKFVGIGRNPLTQNSLVIINPKWFSALSADEQTFLLGRALMQSVPGGFLRFMIKVLPYLFILLTFILILLITWLQGRFTYNPHKRWMRILAAYAIVLALNLTVLNKVQNYTSQYLGHQLDKNIHQFVIAKTGNKQAAVRALEQFDASIKHELAHGETFFAPYAKLFENYAQQLCA